MDGGDETVLYLVVAISRTRQTERLRLDHILCNVDTYSCEQGEGAYVDLSVSGGRGGRDRMGQGRRR